jgi:hypothetical protein
MSTPCTICGRDPREHVASEADEEVVCRGCVANIADQLEGGFRRPRCVGGEGYYVTEDGMFCYCCHLPPSDADFDFFYGQLVR